MALYLGWSGAIAAVVAFASAIGLHLTGFDGRRRLVVSPSEPPSEIPIRAAELPPLTRTTPRANSATEAERELRIEELGGWQASTAFTCAGIYEPAESSSPAPGAHRVRSRTDELGRSREDATCANRQSTYAQTVRDDHGLSGEFGPWIAPVYHPAEPPPAAAPIEKRRSSDGSTPRAPLSEDFVGHTYPQLLARGYTSGPDWQESPWLTEMRACAATDGLEIVTSWVVEPGSGGCWLAWLACGDYPEPFTSGWQPREWAKLVERCWGERLQTARCEARVDRKA